MAREVPTISASEYGERRARILGALPDGILLLQARPEAKAMEQWGFVQEASFQYFTGLIDLPSAILALDGPRGEAHLFVPPPPVSFGLPVADLVPTPGPATARTLGLTSVRAWDRFQPWVEGRMAQGIRRLYLDAPRRAVAPGAPPGFGRVAGHLGLWETAVRARFPNAEVASAKGAIDELRWRKSPAEVAILERNAGITAKALQAVARRLEPGMSQRQAEGVVVSTCLDEGGEGPSFWPWTMAGPNAAIQRLVGTFYRYHHSNRILERGELVRVDIGCAGGGYGADVGRTLPASGRFSEGQREAWDLLVEGYLAGIEAMAHGVPVRDVRAASRAAVSDRAPSLTTETGQMAAEAILAGGDRVWHLHGVGIESGEDALDVLQEGAVVAYEPGVQVGPDAYYLEDMIVITAEGARVLSEGLPRHAREVEAVMESREP